MKRATAGNGTRASAGERQASIISAAAALFAASDTVALPYRIASQSGVLLLALVALHGNHLASAQQDAFQHDRPGRPPAAQKKACSSTVARHRSGRPVYRPWRVGVSRASRIC